MIFQSKIVLLPLPKEEIYLITERLCCKDISSWICLGNQTVSNERIADLRLSSCEDRLY
jgi:hypothetical protein